MESVRKRLQTVRCEVQKKCNKKSGKNNYAGFDYFQLEDFLPTANEEFNKVGLCPVYTIEYEGERQMACLTIEDGDDKLVFKIPTAEVVMGNKPNPIQSLGAMVTYTKRYLYMNCLELSEGDVVDATIGKEEKEDKFATYKQVYDLKLGYPEEAIKTICQRAGVDSPEKLPQKMVKELIEQRKEIIKQRKKEMQPTENLDLKSEPLPFY